MDERTRSMNEFVEWGSHLAAIRYELLLALEDRINPAWQDGPRSFIIRSSLWIKNPSSSNYDNCLLAAAGATSNPESKGVELFVLPSPGHRFLPTAFVQFFCSSSQLIVLVNTVRSSSCEYQSRRRARLACKIRFVPLAKHWYMLRPSLPWSLRGERYSLLNWG